MSVLECSSNGCKMFSAFYAKVKVFNVLDSIENHYQKSKAFLQENGTYKTYTNWRDVKGKKPDAFLINGEYMSLEYGIMFYDLLWYKYLKENPQYIEYLAKYDDYKDTFRSKNSLVCQADSIRKFMQDEKNNKYPPELRGKALYDSCKPLLKRMK